MINKKKSAFIRYAVRLGAAITIAMFVSIVIYVISIGITHIKPELFEFKYTTDNASMLPAILNTLEIVIISTSIAALIGIFSAIYLVEYAKKNSKLVKLIRLTVETLAGIPSIVYGLFGYLAFVVALKLGYSIIAGALTLSVMVLPLIIRTTEEALLGVDDMYREGSYGLGAGKIRTIFKIVIPAAAPGILSGVILAIGRMVGETAALLYTSSSVPDFAGSLTSPGRTLSVHMYALLSEGIYKDQAYATAVILLVFIIAINAVAKILFKKLNTNK